jgi:hypothetical protein
MKTSSSFLFCKQLALLSSTRSLFLRAFGVALVVVSSGCAWGGEEGWKPLFNGQDLEGWTMAVEGAPVGEDPKGHIVVRDGAIHMYADTAEDARGDFGVIVTEGVYSRYHLSLEYAWGAKRFEPRKELLRDAGLLYHIADPNERTWGIWPVSMECQIQEGDTGDLVFLKVRGLTWLHPQDGKAPEGLGEAGLLPEFGGRPMFCSQQHYAYVGRYPVYDRLEGWNRVEAIVQGAESATHLINGQVRSRLFRLTNDQLKPLASGHIALQLEGAEVMYRHIRIRELPPPLTPSTRYVALSRVPGLSPAVTEVEIHNPGPVAVDLDLTLIGSHSSLFRVALPPDAPAALAPGASVRVAVEFVPGDDAGRYSAGLQVGPLDVGAFLVLQGLALVAPEGDHEPTLKQLVDALGIPLDVGGEGLYLDTEATTIGASVAATALARVSDAPVRITPLARFSSPGKMPLYWQARGDSRRHSIATLPDSAHQADAHQRLLPSWSEGAATVSFDPGDGPFSLMLEAGQGVIALDPAQSVSKIACPVRLFPIHTAFGAAVTNAVLAGFEEAANGDYQDVLFLIENVYPVTD